jgi:integrase
LTRNPVKKVDFFKVKSKKERVTTDKEREELLLAAKSSSSDTLYVFLVIAFNTGMRKMEILSLEWKNVDFSKKTITVSKERAKSGKSREIPMNDIVAEELIKRDKTDRCVFYNSKTGTYIRNIKTAFWKACENAGVKNFRVHDLRHSTASYMINDCGIDIKTAAEILGHCDITMTAKYIHPTSEHKRLAVDRLGEIFKTGRKKVDTGTGSVMIKKLPLPHMRAH